MNKTHGKPDSTAASWPWEEACCGVMASALGDGLAVLDHSFCLITCNAAFKALVGRESVSPGDHVPGMFPASCRGALERVLAAGREGEPCRAELGFDQDEFPAGEPHGLRVLASVTPLPCNPGRPAAIGLLLVDVSALIEAREVRNRETL